MSFNKPRGSDNKLIKSNANINTSPTLNQAVSLGTTGETTFASVNSLSLNGTTITPSAVQLNAVDTTPGTAKPSKAVILDSSSNIVGINALSCNSLRVNNVDITASMFSSGTSNDAANPYFTSVTPGTAKASKALIFDASNNISNINNISTTSLNVNNAPIVNYKQRSINLNSIYESRLSNNTILTGSLPPSSGSYALDNSISKMLWKSVCWSSELSLYVAVCNGGVSGYGLTDNRIMTSSDGLNWTLRTSPVNTNFNAICWSKELNLFVAVGDNNIISSSNGINWTSRSVKHQNTWTSICWSKELGIFAAVGTNADVNCIMTSSDGINWTNRVSPTPQWKSVCWSPELNLFVAVANTSSSNVDRVMTSSNGITWTLGTTELYYDWATVCWSAELGIFLAVRNGTPCYMISSDGFNWNIYQDTSYSTVPTCVCWSKDLELFIGIDNNSNNCYILYSTNGYNWFRSNSVVDSNQYSCIIWNPDHKQFLAVSAYSQWNSANARVVVSNPIVPSIMSNFNNYITFSNTNSYVGINSTSYVVPLEINSSTGNCFKHYNARDTSYFVTHDILSTGQFNITSPGYISIPQNAGVGGLMLNNTLVNSTATEFNTYLQNNTPGTAQASKIVMLDSSLNISGINSLSCNSIIVNGTELSNSNTNQYLQNAVAGTASASSAIITDTNNNVSNINSLNTTNLILNDSKIKISSTESNINLTIIQDNIKYSKAGIHNALTNLKNRSPASGSFWCAAYSPELNIFVAGSSYGTNRLAYSRNAITWTDIVHPLIVNLTFYSICWSPELMLFVACTDNRICRSKDGINWAITYNVQYMSTYQSICWSPELGIFVAVGSNNNYRIATSRDGIVWTCNYIPNYNTALKTVCWCNTIGLFIAGASDTNNTNIITSPDGMNWTTISLNNYTAAINNIEWSEELNMAIAVCGGGQSYLYSYDGINWIPQAPVVGYDWKNIKWLSEVGIFVSVGSGTCNIVYSYNGINWRLIDTNSIGSSSITNTSVMWSPELSMIVIATNGGTSTSNIVTSGIIAPSARSCIKSHTNEFIFDNTNGYMGLGVTPTYQLHLSSDSAAKPSTSTWTVSSDARLKDNIQDADLDMCYNNIKNLRLAKYTWKDDVYTTDEVADRSKLGWIAQEVETIYPKAVEKVNMHGYEDCRTLNTDQIIASMYGCAKKIIKNYSDDDSKINKLFSNLQNVELFVNSLPDE